MVGGDHYLKYLIPPREYSKANGLDPDQFNVVRYITRFRDKNGKEDLLKAKHVIELILSEEYPEETKEPTLDYEVLEWATTVPWNFDTKTKGVNL